MTFTAETPVTLPEGRTNADLAKAAVAYREALASCNADKAGIRAWFAKLVGAK